LRRAPYERELEELPTTYQSALESDISPLREGLALAGEGPTLYVGTGGTTPLARLAAWCHEDAFGHTARAVTPLELLMGPVLPRASVVFFSARAKHPDAIRVLQHLAKGQQRHAVVITHRRADELDHVLRGAAAVVSLPPPAIPEGFLATNSVLSMATTVLRAFEGDEILVPGDLMPAWHLPLPRTSRRNIVALHTPSLAAVASDVETRCHEIGVAAVQVSDLRNFAHGRHTGTARHAGDTSVILVSDQRDGDLAARTARVLPEEFEVLDWHHAGSHASATLCGLVGSMRLTAALGARCGVDPARPRVPAFGRKLYHLKLPPVRRQGGPVATKARASGAGALGRDITAAYSDAYTGWRRALSRTSIGGIVFDYDGTIVETGRRRDPPDDETQHEVIRMLELGVPLAFASGRGPSLHAGLRAWVPEERWGQVSIGLYNGAVRCGLSDDLPNLKEPSPLMSDVAARLGAMPASPLIELTARRGQVTAEVRPGAWFNAGRLADLAREALARPPALPVKVVQSGHSVDIVEADTSKVSVLWDLESRTAGREVLAIGDQGDLGGNDFELLAARRWSVSLDRCSADPTRCWYIDDRGRRGPAALVALLRAVRPRDGGLQVRTPLDPDRRGAAR